VTGTIQENARIPADMIGGLVTPAAFSDHASDFRAREP
jgi:hypothetical protein